MHNRDHRRRMTIVGGALLGLVEAGSAEADAMLDNILQKIPKKQRKPFDGWNRPRSPARAARAAKEAATSQQPTGEPQSAAAASPPDAHAKGEKTPESSTTAAAGKKESAAAHTRDGEGRPTSTGTAPGKHAEPTQTPGDDTEAEPSEPKATVDLDQGSASAAAATPPDARAKG